jgi:cytochrome c oxidase cbb3-type subunit 4
MNFASPHEVLASIWTVWAVALFVGIVCWAWRPANRERFDHSSRIPLDDDN